MTATESLMQVRVKRISYEAESINSYELVAPTGGNLAPFTAGSHIDLYLAHGMIRSYSLVNDQSEQSRYVIAVNKDAASRGGSRFVHETLRAGDVITISHPRNNFALQENARHSVLIAGGIGITPLLSMIRRLEALGRSWELFYAARTRLAAAFLDQLNGLQPKACANLHLNFDHEPSGRLFDLTAITRDAPQIDGLTGSKLERVSICEIKIIAQGKNGQIHLGSAFVLPAAPLHPLCRSHRSRH